MEKAHQLIGRKAEVDRFEAALDGLGGGGRVLAIEGEAGIGKTRLLAELRALADARGHLALTGRSAEFEGQLPFGALVDALDDYLASRPAGAFGLLEEEQLAELAVIFPSLSGLGEGAPRGLQDERYRSHGAVRALLESLGADKPLVLALDDLHWADDATTELLAHLLRRPPRGPVLLALAFRRGQAPPPLAAGLDDARRAGSAVVLEPGPLTEEEAGELLGGDLEPRARTELHRLSGGNPFYLEELARHGGPPLPRAVADALARELASMPPVTAEVARGAAVAGEAFDAELAAEAADVPEPEALAAIDELLARDILRRTDAPRRFRFRHPIVHRAVYEATGAGWRLGAHARVATGLGSRGAPALARAPHVEAAAKPGDLDAVTVLREAGNAAALRAPASAAHWYGAALRLLPGEDPGAKLALLVPMAQALGYSGRSAEARAALDEVLALLPPDQLAIRGQVIASAARLDQLLGRHEEARRSLLDGLAEVPDPTGAEATELKVQLAGASFFSGDFEGLQRWVSEALAEAESRGDEATRAAATGTLGCAEYMVGNLDAARLRLEEAEDLLADLPDEEVARRLHSVIWCGITEVYLERFERAEAIFDRCLAVARATGHGHVASLTRIGRGQLGVWRGQLDRAIEETDAAAESADLTGNGQFLTWALGVRSWAALEAGDLDEAIRTGERAVEAAGEPDPVSADARCHLAEAMLEAGRPAAECRELVLESLGGEEMPLVERAFRPRWLELLTRIELEDGDVEAAAVWAERARADADGLGIAGRSADALAARAAVALARGDGKTGASLASQAAAEASRAGLPLAEGRARLLAGRALASSDAKAAAAEVEAAVALFDRHGAARSRDRAASELRSLGGRTSRPRRPRSELGEGLGALSPREVEVADRVAEGRTNKEIASALFLSEKTIEKHMASIFGKLGVSKRAQVAARVERERQPARG